MSKPIKALIEKELVAKFKDFDSAAVINPRGIDAIKNNQIRRRLHEKGLRMTVVRNALAKRATSGTKLSGLEKLLEGPSAVIYGKASVSAVARLLLEEKKLDEKIELRGILFDGDVYSGEDGIKTVSQFPTREEAIGQIISALMGPGASVLGALLGPGSTVASLIKAIEEKAEKSGAAEAAPAAPTA